ncbi:DUF2971 domain-containing protein [Occallatibacter riparius]|uniref:DUF2971 domain-containing protein n=1 Tax=Occallatibacter riparius TaxID=1002689 RepID=A0A9J7BNU7_9BACT|nr:DUF2971 domain-containing protein [Occallatibacter riparius]UWZ84556.1 DUF2971 domain-containing protein [Occallatibacter riparius]
MAEITENAFNPTTDPGKLKGFLESIGSFSEDLILWFNVGQKLYHYTNLEGLLGILSKNDLWLTHAQYCNDEQELTHGLQLTRKVIEEQAQGADPKRKSYLEELLSLLTEPKLDPVYVCCFCERDDLLSQWRAYAANATGVSIEFEPANFSYITGPDCPPTVGLMRFWKVFYSPETQQKIIRSAINYYPFFDQAAAPSDWAKWTAEAIRFFIPTFKNKDFVGEEEWRLIFTPASGGPVKPSYRVRGGMLVPYYSLIELCRQLGLPDQKLPLASVRIGPSPNKRLNAASVRMMLDRHGYESARVELSDTPYRG